MARHVNKKAHVFRRTLNLLLVAAVTLGFAGFSSMPASAVVTPENSVSAPQSVTATGGAQAINLTWSAPAQTGTYTVSGYQIEYSTTGAADSWTVFSSNIAANATSETITGLQTSTSYYTRIAALVDSGTKIGAYGYTWTSVYMTTNMSRDSLQGPFTYNSTYGTLARTDFTRVRYKLSHSGGYADVDFYRSLTGLGTGSETYDSLYKLQVPVPSGGTSAQFELQAVVSDMNVSSDVSGVAEAQGIDGKLEIWPWDYDPAGSTNNFGGNDAVYDVGDNPKGTDEYGSFQVHTTTDTILAWNQHGVASPDIGFGNNTVAAGNGQLNPDWTFRANGSSLTNFRWESFANFPVSTTSSVAMPGAPGKPSVTQINGTAISATFAAPVSGGTVASYSLIATSGSGAIVTTSCPSGAGVACAITGLQENMGYDLVARATNAAGSTDSTASGFNTFYALATSAQTTSFSSSNFALGGNANLSGVEASLTQAAGAQAGAIWGKNRISMNDDFVLDAQVYLGNSDAGADGLAFVLQTKSTSALTSGGGLGYAGMTAPMFGVEFDTYNNGGEEQASDHIALMKNGSATAHTQWGTSIQNVSNLEDGNYRNFRFSYLAPRGAVTSKLRVEVDLNYDGDYRDASELVFDTSIDLKTFFGASSQNVYWGFTAATGGAVNLQKVKIDRVSASTRINQAPTVALATQSAIAISAGSSQTVNITLSDDATTVDQWSVTASSNNGRITVPSSATITSATAATLQLTAPGNATQGTAVITLTGYDADGEPHQITFNASVGVLPGTPTATKASPQASKIVLDWTAPTNAVSASVTDYTIEYSSNNGTNWSTYSDGTSTSTTADITGLTRSRTYLFRVAAVNATGTGDYSEASSRIRWEEIPASLELRAPTLTFTPGNASTLTTAQNAMLQAKIVAPTSSTPAVEIVKDVSAAQNSSDKKVTDSTTIPAGTQAKASIKVASADAVNKVAAGFIRIGSGNWYYLGNKDIAQDGTASSDAMAFAAPTSPGSEYVLVVAIVTSTYGESDVVSMVRVGGLRAARISPLSSVSYTTPMLADSTLRRAAVTNANIASIGTAQIQLSVTVTGSELPTTSVASSGSGGGSSTPSASPTPTPTVSPSPSASPKPTVKPTPKPTSSSGNSSGSAGGSTGGTDSGAGASAGSGDASGSGDGSTDGSGDGSGSNGGSGDGSGDGSNPAETSAPNALDPVAQATVQALPWLLVVGGAAVLWFMFFLARKRRRKEN